MEETGPAVELDDFLPRDVRTFLEERFWRPIEAQATLEVLRDDPEFLADPGRHPAIFADHGVVHVRDVAIGLARLLDTINGVLLPCRSPERQRFVQTLGVGLAYLHDIGMVDMTRSGRRVHALFAAHAAFGPDVGPLIDRLLATGPVGARLAETAAQAPFATSLEIVLREMLSMSVAHSKSAVPSDVLDDRAAFRRLMQRVIFTTLDDHRTARQHPRATDTSRLPADANTDRYDDPSESFAWLSAESGPHAELADDVVDALRALRAADVLRQRGTVLRTSGGFEVCMDAETARAVCTLRPATGDAAYVVIYDDARGAGEANVSAAFVTPQGHLRIAFHRGGFGSEEAAQRAAASVADVVVDIQADVIPSFGGVSIGGGLIPQTRSVEDVLIQLERPDDRPAFADDVLAQVAALDPSIARRLVSVADTDGAAPAEQRRFFAAAPVDGLGSEADELLRRMARHGVATEGLDRAAAFAEVGRASIQAGEVLVVPGSSPSFVYVPTGPGLVVRPDGGYAPSPLPPWVPVGTTGVIRRAERNSEIVAQREVEVIMIPGELYARAWLRPLRVDELAVRLHPPVATP
ncbi:MAG TPA: hypothetical protein VD763_09405 [Candidatus Saccharimonadales bacterium]|nr:hypothetical protein [Candidatus Saccharimonadales bacterium]